MREIKFRAFDEADGFHRDEPSMSYGIDPKCDADFIMQYTGLKDKNGKEIFEGDVVNIHFNQDQSRIPREPTIETTVIQWQEDMASFECFLIGNRHRHEVTHYKRLGVEAWGYEVIGNIHENPELLK